MSVCPLCEALAESRVCEVCGHVFAPEVSPPTAPPPRLAELDAAPSVGGLGPVVPLTDLEPTRFAATAAAEGSTETDWERTRVGEVPDVSAGGLEELERGREAPDAERTLPSVVSVTCRYCRNVQASGLLCERCGMRLPWSVKVAASSRPTLDPDLLVRCPLCGVRTYQRERCAACGGLLATEA